jgi:hypothetical protein
LNEIRRMISCDGLVCLHDNGISDVPFSVEWKDMGGPERVGAAGTVKVCQVDPRL